MRLVGPFFRWFAVFCVNLCFLSGNTLLLSKLSFIADNQFVVASSSKTFLLHVCCSTDFYLFSRITLPVSGLIQFSVQQFFHLSGSDEFCFIIFWLDRVLWVLRGVVFGTQLNPNRFSRNPSPCSHILLAFINCRLIKLCPRTLIGREKKARISVIA